MLDPAAYASLHPVTGPVSCIETHVSWVFLAGDYAYKVKKPIQLRFLDYSTQERRAWLCHEELRLNRRHAPDLYLDVVPIGGTPTGPRVGDVTTPPFEHALRMVQFDTSQELTHLLQANAVSLQECAALGSRMAAMHAAAPSADPHSLHGEPDALHRTTLDNFAEISRVLCDAAVAAQLQRLQAHLQTLFDRCRTRMSERRSRGYVREVHGDLHCGNVVRWRDTLVAFDGLEFDPALRYIDVISDIAFLTMDLGVNGRDDLRRETLQAWLTANGDFDAVALLPYYEGYRALVRAKVAALRGIQTQAVTVESMSLARQYLDWARARIARPRPLLVVMAGLSGSGKTWLAQRIAHDIGALVLRSDIERKRLAGLQPLQSSASAPDADLYSVAFNVRTYDHLRVCVERCLQGGESVVIDAANLRHDERDRFLAIAHDHSAQSVIVHCMAPLEVRRARVASRAASGADASEATLDLLDRQPSYWEPFGEQELEHLVTVDTNESAAIERCLLALQARRAN